MEKGRYSSIEDLELTLEEETGAWHKVPEAFVTGLRIPEDHVYRNKNEVFVPARRYHNEVTAWQILNQGETIVFERETVAV